MADGSRDFLAASMAFQQIGDAFKVTGPAMSLVTAQFTAGTMGARMDLMMSLMDLAQSPGFTAFMTNFSDLVSVVMSVVTEVTGWITKLGNELEPFRKGINEYLKELKGTTSQEFWQTAFQSFFESIFSGANTGWSPNSSGGGYN